MIKSILRCFCCKVRRNVSVDIRNNLIEEKNILNFKINKKIGEGKFGDVYLCVHKLTNKLYAIKKSKTVNRLFVNELKYLRRIKHSSLIELKESFLEESYHYLVLEYYPQGDLFKYIKERHDFDDIKIRKIILNILRPLLFLKQCKVVHLDIKPENYLIRDINKLDIVLTDFGTMREYKELNKEYNLRNVLGTKLYASPEVLKKSFNSKSDVWSLGQIMLILVSGKMISYNEMLTQLDINDMLREFKVGKSYNLIKSCLTINILNRIDLEDIIDNKWLEEYYMNTG